MTAFHAFQTLFALAVVALVVERCWALLFRAPLSEGPFRRAIVEMLEAGEIDRARSLVRAALPSAVAACVWPLLDPALAPADRALEADDRLLVEQARAERGLRALRLAATIGSALGFLGAALEIHWIFSGSHGLLRLQAGLVENIAFGHALLAIAIGLATSSLAIGASMVLRKAATGVVAQARRAVAVIAEALEPGPVPSPDGTLHGHREPPPSHGV